MFFIVFRLLILKPRPSVPACPASGVMERLGWGGAGGFAAAQDILHFLNAAAAGQQVLGGWEWGVGKGVYLLSTLTSQAGRLSQETPDGWKPRVCMPQQANSNQAGEEPLTTLTHWERLTPMGSGKSWQDLQWPFSTPLAAEPHLRDARQLCPRCPASKRVSEGTAAQTMCRAE